ncbi:MAG: DUF502 domain-containing protein [Bacteroidetes bacterium]|jgi:uncharacterized membrane protein|nr:DUF502 domain-containing protein [Bacteroidota bacterium]MBX7238652.1 DUF502 domain-containing protein [Bacteroidia bacterium]MCW5918756.1 DUF502 domain-containing protein [Bacteroidota bacterium]HMU78145.1 DUF502 domain-containing protein [Bacteroidia bacterium]HMW09528.1 DUF502 domain-containing protein [Bacteroidia bacterium]
MKKLLNYFFQGLLVVVPIAVTIFVIYKIITWIDNLLPFQIPVKLPGIGEVSIPGLGILTIVVAVTAFGYLAKFFVANPFFVLLERMLERTPLLKIIYTSVKDLIEAFVGEKKRFNQPVLVTVDKVSGVQRIGFITQKDLSVLGISSNKMAVYLPFSYGFNGQLVIVPAENVEKIDASGTEMMKFVISGGVTEVD